MSQTTIQDIQSNFLSTYKYLESVIKMNKAEKAKALFFLDPKSKLMEIINKRHEDVRLSRRTESMPYINFNTSKQILFSVHAVRWLGLQAGLYIHFVNDDDLWYFYVNDDKDGFKIFSREGKTNVFLFNAHLVNLFLKRTKYQLKSKFILEKTQARHRGFELIKINTDKPIL